MIARLHWLAFALALAVAALIAWNGIARLDAIVRAAGGAS
jgi:hypothetical protein